MRNGILLINKPKDFTSHDVVAKTRGILQTRKIGHSGTLDPMATGVLPLFIGTATKAIDRMTNHDKTYIATFRLGTVTDTQDITGKIVETNTVSATCEQVRKTIMEFSGTQQQTPPIYSALWVEGRRLYDIARSGGQVEIPSREITVYSIKLLSCDEENHEYTIEASVSKGTYIRTICHDIGSRLGCGAVLIDLVRSVASGFSLEKCTSFDTLQQLADKGKVDDIILPVETVFQNFTKVTLPPTLVGHFRNGVPLWLTQLSVEPSNQWVRFYDEDDSFVGIGVADMESGKLREQKRF